MKKAIKKTTPNSGIIVQNINITPNYRKTQDIGTWRNAIRYAEAKNPNRVELYDLYEDILLDGRLSSVIDKRKRAIRNSIWTFQSDNIVNDEITKLITKQPWFYNFLDDILDTIFWGHTAFEFNISNNTISYEIIPRKHVEPFRGIICKEQFLLNDGINYRAEPFNRYVIEVGNKPYMGVLLKAAQYVIYKRGGFGDWAQFAEIFGMPFRVGTYDGYDENARIKLEEALRSMGGASHIVKPEGTNIEFIESKNTSGSNSLYDALIKACNTEISTLVLGNTLTTEQGEKGARALGDVHLQIEDTVHMSDVLYVSMVLNNQFKQLLLIHGINCENGEFVRMESQELDLEKRIDIDVKLRANVKLPISDDYFYETYNIPKPDNYNELKEEIKQQNSLFPAAFNNYKNEQLPVKASPDKAKNITHFFQHLKDFFS
ncbi:MAG: DUF935 family protein [Clostridia bacterium]|nr:DUF935 family protein [Clostridia bacterium]